MPGIDSCLVLETAPGFVQRHRRRILLGLISLAALGLAAIFLIVVMSATRRDQALRFLDARGVDYEFAADDAWIFQRLGGWAEPFRNVSSITIPDTYPNGWSPILEFSEVKSLEVPSRMLTADSVRKLSRLSELETIETDWVRDDSVRRTIESRWTLDERVSMEPYITYYPYSAPTHPATSP